jgi:hypothetical protein
MATNPVGRDQSASRVLDSSEHVAAEGDQSYVTVDLLHCLAQRNYELTSDRASKITSAAVIRRNGRQGEQVLSPPVCRLQGGQ